MAVSSDEALQLEQDALHRYWAAVELADSIRQAWEEQGKWLTVTLPNQCEVEAPLLKLLRQAERDCERFARAVPTPERRPGRKPVAVVEPALLRTPLAQLDAKRPASPG
jgi:capsid protein